MNEKERRFFSKLYVELVMYQSDICDGENHFEHDGCGKCKYCNVCGALTKLLSEIENLGKDI